MDNLISSLLLGSHCYNFASHLLLSIVVSPGFYVPLKISFKGGTLNNAKVNLSL